MLLLKRTLAALFVGAVFFCSFLFGGFLASLSKVSTTTKPTLDDRKFETIFSSTTERANNPQHSSEILIVLDAGHGGNDPGKVGVNGTLEKDINLCMVLKLRTLLEQEGYLVSLTRDSDDNLSTSSDSTKSCKISDMRNRVSMIEDCHPTFVISIHQNSYPDENVSGPQVFYYTDSTCGMKLASCLQDSLNTNTSTSGKREIAANDSYYILKKTPTPTVIVECGFLSNPYEESLLCDSNYQDELCHAIILGIKNYLNPSIPEP